MKILIIEPEFEGHHISLYLRLILKELLKNNIEFKILTTKKTIKSKPYKLLDKELSVKKKTFVSKESLEIKKKTLLNLLLFQIRYFLFIKKNLKLVRKNFKYDQVYFGHLDPFFFIFSIFLKFLNQGNLSGLLCNIRFYQSTYKIKKFRILDFIKFILFKISLKSKDLKKIFIVDELFYRFLKNRLTKSQLKKILFVSEACELINTKSKLKLNNLKLRFDIKKKEKIILVYGDLKSRKGIFEFIEIIKDENFPKNIKIIFAGKQSNKVENYIKKNIRSKKDKKKLILINKFIDRFEESNFFGVADVIWLAYSGGSDGSSGVLKQAALARKPIIESGRGLISWINKKNKIGISINLKNKIDSINRIKKFLYNNKTYNFHKKNVNIYAKKINTFDFSQKIVNEFIKSNRYYI